MYLPAHAKDKSNIYSRNGMDTHARQVETNPHDPSRRLNVTLGPHGQEAGHAGDPEISLGWRHSD